MAKKTVRVLVDTVIDGQQCKCGELIEADAEILKPYLKESVDATKAAVDYALSQGIKVRTLEAVTENSESGEAGGGERAGESSQGSGEQTTEE